MIEPKAIMFCSEFMARAENYSQSYSSNNQVMFGNHTLNLRINRKSEFGELILGSFIQKDSPEDMFRLDIWDSEFPFSIPDHSWSVPYQHTHTPVPFEITDPYRVYFDSSQGMIYVYDTENRIGSIWLRHSWELDIRCFITPFKLMLSWMALSINAEILHASAAQIGGKGFIFGGPSGSGKSTLALYAALSGNKILSDDTVLYDSGEVFAIYSRLKLNKDNPLINFDEIEKEVVPFNFEGKLTAPLKQFGVNFVTQFRLDAIALPIIAHLSFMAPLSNSDAEHLFISQSLREIFGGQEQNIHQIKEIISKHDKYRLALSGGLERDFELLHSRTS